MVTDNQALFKMYLDALAADPSILKTEDSSIGIAGRINKLEEEQVELKGQVKKLFKKQDEAMKQ